MQCLHAKNPTLCQCTKHCKRITQNRITFRKDVMNTVIPACGCFNTKYHEHQNPTAVWASSLSSTEPERQTLQPNTRIPSMHPHDLDVPLPQCVLKTPALSLCMLPSQANPLRLCTLAQQNSPQPCASQSKPFTNTPADRATACYRCSSAPCAPTHSDADRQIDLLDLLLLLLWTHTHTQKAKPATYCCCSVALIHHVGHWP